MTCSQTKRPISKPKASRTTTAAKPSRNLNRSRSASGLLKSPTSNLDRTIRVLLDRPVLRQQQHESGRNPQHSGDKRAEEIAPTREVGANGETPQGLQNLGAEQQRHDLQCLLGQREPQY